METERQGAYLCTSHSQSTSIWSVHSMDAEQFLEGALQYARQNDIEFDSYDAQYQSLHCTFLPLYYQQATIGIVSMDRDGNFRFTKLAANSEERGAPRNC